MAEAEATRAAQGALDAESAEWVRCLGHRAPDRESALGRLHALLLRAARAELSRRASRTGIGGQEVDDLAHQAADDAVLGIVRRLPDFRGDSWMDRVRAVVRCLRSAVERARCP